MEEESKLIALLCNKVAHHMVIKEYFSNLKSIETLGELSYGNSSPIKEVHHRQKKERIRSKLNTDGKITLKNRLLKLHWKWLLLVIVVLQSYEDYRSV